MALRAGDKINNKQGVTRLTVPEEGGFYFPKKAFANMNHNETVWEHTWTATEDIIATRNKGFKEHNEKIWKELGLSPTGKNLPWWKLW